MVLFLGFQNRYRPSNFTWSKMQSISSDWCKEKRGFEMYWIASTTKCPQNTDSLEDPLEAVIHPTQYHAFGIIRHRRGTCMCMWNLEEGCFARLPGNIGPRKSATFSWGRVSPSFSPQTSEFQNCHLLQWSFIHTYIQESVLYTKIIKSGLTKQQLSLFLLLIVVL
jgi:hypothetical protein